MKGMSFIGTYSIYDESKFIFEFELLELSQPCNNSGFEWHGFTFPKMYKFPFEFKFIQFRFLYLNPNVSLFPADPIQCAFLKQYCVGQLIHVSRGRPSAREQFCHYESAPVVVPLTWLDRVRAQRDGNLSIATPPMRNCHMDESWDRGIGNLIKL